MSQNFMSFNHLSKMASQITSSTILIITYAILCTLIHTYACDEFGLGDPYPPCRPPAEPRTYPIYPLDVDLLQFAINLEHLECDYFLYAALGVGLDQVAPYLTWGGPPPIGAQKANLDPLTWSIVREFGFEEVDHLRALKSTVGGFPRPLLDLSAGNFARIFDLAMGYELDPPFDPYRDSLHYMLSAYVIPYMGLVGYVGANPLLEGHVSKRLQSGLLGVESGQDAVIRMWLYERAKKQVYPYNHTVAEFTERISDLRNRLGACGLKDEGVVVPHWLGAYNSSRTNVLSANFLSLSYQRTPAEILRVVYGTGSEHVPGGFYPLGANGRIARSYLDEKDYPPWTYGDMAEAYPETSGSAPIPQPETGRVDDEPNNG